MQLIRYDDSLWKETLGELGPDEAARLLKDLAGTDHQVRRQVLLEFGELKPVQLQKLLEEGIELETEGGVIPEYGEDVIQELCQALVKRARRIAAKDLAGAVALLAMIVTAIDAHMQKVYDEGWTFQCIVTDAFEVLKELVTKAERITSAAKTKMICLAEQALAANPGDNLYMEEWENLIDQWKRLT